MAVPVVGAAAGLMSGFYRTRQILSACAPVSNVRYTLQNADVAAQHGNLLTASARGKETGNH
jgi:hypothetical protein